MIKLRQGSWKHFKHVHQNLAQLAPRDEGEFGLRHQMKVLREEMCVTHKAFVLFEDGRPVGWALVMWHNFGREFDLQLYVSRANRRRGFGTRLYRRAKKWVVDQGDDYAFFVNPSNLEFFKHAETDFTPGHRRHLSG